MFVDGRYIPPPYVISRREGEVFVNGVHLDWTFLWPPRKVPPPPPPPKGKPEMPATITEKTTPYDKDYIAYISDSRQYLLSKYGEAKGIEKMVDVYRGVPCIREARLASNESNTIEVVWADGSKGGISQRRARRKDDNLTKEQAAKIIDNLTESYYVRGLEDNWYYLEGKGGKRMGLFGGFKGMFTPLAEALRASENEAGFIAAVMTNQPPGNISETWLKLFYSHKDELPKWEHRLREKDPVRY
jgi:hypothetical protein